MKNLRARLTAYSDESRTETHSIRARSVRVNVDNLRHFKTLEIGIHEDEQGLFHVNCTIVQRKFQTKLYLGSLSEPLEENK